MLTRYTRRQVQARTLSAGRLPDGAAEAAVPDQDLPPKHRQAGPDLPGRSQGCVTVLIAPPLYPIVNITSPSHR